MLSGLQQQQRVAGWRGIHDDEMPGAFPDEPGERLEYGQFV
jgi:hypothetical protein